MKMFSFFITDENKKFLKELSQETKTNMSQIINSMINEASFRMEREMPLSSSETFSISSGSSYAEPFIAL